MAVGTGLSTEEILLLENLMYIDGFADKVQNSGGNIQTVGDLIATLDVNGMTDGSFMTETDWANLISAVENNDTLMNMRIAQTHVDYADGGGGGVSAVFVSESTGEAVVAFRGTAGGEWKDNFVGGGPTDASDGVSTPQQENALEWYQDVYQECGLEDYQVTVTGHSKGGNKAKYIALLDPTVDQCVSFDGQGFSDEFMEHYQDEIAQRQGIIENHNVSNDYVNILLNDVGETTFYQGQDYGEGGFLEAHCPNTFLSFDENGNPVMTVAPGGQDQTMAELDQFLNSLLRSLPAQDKAQVLEFIGQIAEGGFGGADVDFFIDLFLDPENLEYSAYVLAYLVEYEQANPDFANSIEHFLQQAGMEEISKWVDIADQLMDWEHFDLLLKAADGLLDLVPGWLWGKLGDWIYENWGIRLSQEELERLAGVLGMVSENMEDIRVKPNSGQDIQVPATGGTHFISVSLRTLQEGASSMTSCGQILDRAASDVRSSRCTGVYMELKYRAALQMIAIRLEREARTCARLADALQQAEGMYRATERNLVSSPGK